MSATGNTIPAGNFTGLYGTPGGVNPAAQGSYSNANVAGFLPIYNGNINNVNTINATGTITGQSVVANVFMWANGTPLVQPQAYGNADVAAYLPTNQANIRAGNLSVTNVTTGNVIRSDNFQFANGTPLSFSVNYSNANVSDYLASTLAVGNIRGGNLQMSSNITGGNVSVTGNVNSTNVYTNFMFANSAIVNGNLAIDNQISAFGNITTQGFFNGNFAGNISGNIVAPGSNTQILFNRGGQVGADSRFTYDSTEVVVSTSGNIAAGNVLTDNYRFANGLPVTFGSNYSNANVANYLPTYTGNITFNNASAVGNITISTGGFFVGNGAFLTGISGSGGVANLSGNLAGNILANGFFINNLTRLSVNGNVLGNVFQTVGTNGNITGANVITANTVSANTVLVGNVSINGNVINTVNLSASGNIRGNLIGNITTTDISVSGNIIANTINTINLSASGNIRGNAFGAALVAGATTGNIPTLSATGNLVDSGKVFDDTTVTNNNYWSANQTSGYVIQQLLNVPNLPAVNIATTANITRSGFGAIDGVTPTGNSYVLVKNQTNNDNGVFLAQTGNWIRQAFINDAYANVTFETTYANLNTNGGIVNVLSGTVNRNLQFQITAQNPGATFGTAPVFVTATTKIPQGSTNNRFVDNSIGNDTNNNGSSSFPFATISRALTGASFPLTVTVGASGSVESSAITWTSSTQNTLIESEYGAADGGQTQLTGVQTFATGSTRNDFKGTTHNTGTSVPFVFQTGAAFRNYFQDLSVFTTAATWMTLPTNASNFMTLNNISVTNFNPLVLPSLTTPFTINCVNQQAVMPISGPGAANTIINILNSAEDMVRVGGDFLGTIVWNQAGWNSPIGSAVIPTGVITDQTTLTTVLNHIADATYDGFYYITGFTPTSFRAGSIIGKQTVAGVGTSTWFVRTPGSIPATLKNVLGTVYTIGALSTFSGLTTVGNVTTSVFGNVTGNFFIGNGALLSGIDTSRIANGTSNVAIATVDGNITMDVNGVSNVVVVTTDSVSVTGNIFATSNVTAANVNSSNIFGDTNSALTLTANNTARGDIHLNAGNIRIGRNNQDANISSRGTGNITISPHEGSVNEGNIILINGANGNININPNGTGNVLISSNVSVVGNVEGNFFIGNGSLLTGIAGGGGTTIANGTSNVNIAVANGNISMAVANTANVVIISDTSVSTTGNILTAGRVSATGNIAGNVFLGNGSQLTGIALSTIANGTSNVNIASANANVRISVANTANVVTVATDSLSVAGNIFASGRVNANTLSVAGNVTISGNANIQGNLTYNNITNLTTSNLVLGLGNTQTGADVTGGGMVIGNTNEASWLYNQAASTWMSNIGISAVGNITSNSFFIGNGSQLTGLTSGPIIANGTSSINIGTANGAITFRVANVAQGNITATSVAIGNQAGFSAQGVNAVAIGTNAGNASQNANSVAIGTQAGQTNQGANGVAIGGQAGFSAQGALTVAVGREAGFQNQNIGAMAIGYQTGYLNQGIYTVAQGYQSGFSNQQQYAVAQGFQAGQFSQGQNSIAIGRGAGQSVQGTAAIAIGAFAGFVAQGNNTIVLNATGVALDTPSGVGNATFIDPIRSTTSTTAIGNIVVYNTATKELNFANTVSIAGNITSGNILTAGNISAAGNVSSGNLVLTGNIVDTGALSVVTGTNGNITLAPNGTGNVIVAANLSASGTIRDSLGPVRTMLSGQITVPDGSYSVTVNNSIDVGAAFTLPAAGTYLISYTLRMTSAGPGQWGTAFLADVNNIPLPGSDILPQFLSGITYTDFQTTVSSTYLITTTGSATYKMRLRGNNGTIAALSDGGGRCRVAWVQVSA